MNTAITATTPTEYSYNDRYINRELSILDFHLRVLEQAVDPLHPLLERMISSRESMSSSAFRDCIVALGGPEVSSLWHQQQKNPPFVLKHDLYEY